MKIIIAFLVFISVTFAGMVNGIAFTVNEEVVTLYELDQTITTLKLSKEEAIKKLIIDKLKDIEIKKNNIDIDYFELNKEAENIAARNGMTLLQFKQYLSSKYISYDTYIDGLKEQLITQKLFSIISRDTLTRPTEEEMRIYYESNKEIFSSVDEVEVIEYTSSNQESLMRALNTPLAVIPDVNVVNKTYKLNEIDPQLRGLFLQTKEGSYTQIFPMQNQLVSFYMSAKRGVTIKSFEDSMEMVLGLLLKEKEQAAAQTYFEKLRNDANIVFIR